MNILGYLGSAALGGVTVGLWKALSGYFKVNLSIAIEVRRTPGTLPGTHDMVVLVKLKKGDRASLAVEKLSIWLFPGERNLNETALLDEQPTWTITPLVFNRPLNLTPGEETHFAFHQTISESITVFVVSKVEGRTLRRKWWPRSGWLASDISTHYLKDSKLPQNKPHNQDTPAPGAFVT
jgi:hypothetical protein